MTTPKTKEKLFRVTEETDARLDYLIQYAHKSGYIARPSLQEFIEFAMECAEGVLKQHYGGAKPEEKVEHRRRPIV